MTEDNERPAMQTRDERANLATTDPVMIAVVNEIRSAGLKPAERSEILDMLLKLRDKTRDGRGVTAAQLAYTVADAAEQVESHDVARVLRKIAPRLVTGETTR